jgi:hypothetical protein
VIAGKKEAEKPAKLLPRLSRWEHLQVFLLATRHELSCSLANMSTNATIYYVTAMTPIIEEGINEGNFSHNGIRDLGWLCIWHDYRT